MVDQRRRFELSDRWSKKAKITFETTFWRNTSVSIFKLCPFLHIIKALWWNLIKFLNFANAFRGDTQDFLDALLILTLPASKWLQKIGRAHIMSIKEDSKLLWWESFLSTVQYMSHVLRHSLFFRKNTYNEINLKLFLKTTFDVYLPVHLITVRQMAFPKDNFPYFTRLQY